MSFKLTIPGVSLKVFGRAIQSLSKIGDELYFEPREDGLFLRSVNSCRSAYACFQFAPNFFLHYVDTTEDGDEEGFRCKIGMKSVMTVFRNLATIDKTVEKCRISLHSDEDRLVFQMYCRHGIIKTHKLAFIECETLQAVSPKDMCPNKITSLPKLLCDAVLNFQANQEEITLVVRPDYTALQNYIDVDQDATKVMRTEMTLSPAEFDQYQVGVDSDITFCLKELRAILAFTDLTNLPLTLQFDVAGRPITFSVTGDLSYEATFVLATLADTESSQLPPQSTQEQSQRANNSRVSNQKSQNKGQAQRNGTSATNKSRHSRLHSNHLRDNHGGVNDTEADKERLEMSTTLNVEVDVSMMDVPAASASNRVTAHGRDTVMKDDKGNNSFVHSGRGYDDGYSSMMRSHHNHTTIGSKNGDRSTPNRESLHKVSNNGDSMDCLVAPVGIKNTHRDRVDHQELTGDGPLSDVAGSQVIPVQNATLPIDNCDVVEPEDEDDEEEIPATPPRKKFCKVFFGTQSSSTQPSQSQSTRLMLAPASDDDNDSDDDDNG